MTILRLFSVAMLIAASLSIGGCRRSYVIENQGPIYTVTNLHLDARRNTIWSESMVEQPVIPVCTPVQIGAIGRNGFKMTVQGSGQQLSFRRHRGDRRPIDAIVSQLFGTQCPDTASLSAIDQQGVQTGQILPGMSKQGALIALGIPPVRLTPNLQADQWVYYRNPKRRVRVIFQGGVVVGVQY